jgi:transcriptional regulator with XRE-family HTH domain
MEQFTKVQWIKEGDRLKKLREDHQISRAELARLMHTSATRLARLEKGDGVRDAHTLSHFYEHIIKQQDLVEEFEALSNDWNEMMEQYMLVKQFIFILNDIRAKNLTNNI